MCCYFLYLSSKYIFHLPTCTSSYTQKKSRKFTSVCILKRVINIYKWLESIWHVLHNDNKNALQGTTYTNCMKLNTYNPPDSNTDENGKWTLVEYFSFLLPTANCKSTSLSAHYKISVWNELLSHYYYYQYCYVMTYPFQPPPHQVRMLHVLAGHNSCNTEYSTVLWAKICLWTWW